jgi:hypothetical protein
MRLLWVAGLPLLLIGFNMATQKGMRKKMLKAKSSPYLKMGARKKDVGPSKAVARGYATGKGMGRGN